MNLLILLTFAAPLLAALLVWVLPGAGVRSFRSLALAGTGGSLAATLGLLMGFDPASPSNGEIHQTWFPALGLSIHLGVDGLSLPLLFLTGLVALAAVLVIDTQTHRARNYHGLLLVLTATTQGALVSRDLLLFFFLCEAAALPKFLLTSGWGLAPEGKPHRSKDFVALQQTLFLSAGAFCALIGILALHQLGGGSFDLDHLRTTLRIHPPTAHTQFWVFGTLLIGFGVWTSLWPFHSWSPIAYATAPTSAAMFFAGVSKNLGGYAILRTGISLLPEGAHAWAALLAPLAAIQILYGGWVAMRQKDWHRMIGYSSVSHVGYLLLGLSAMNGSGLTGAVLFMVAHGLMTALLLALAGHIRTETGSATIDSPGGLAGPMPWVAVALTAGVMASGGVPGFANFAGELLIFLGSWNTIGWAGRIGTIAAVWGLVVTMTYLLRAVRSGLHGTSASPATYRDATFSLRLAAGGLLLSLVILGVMPRLLTDAIQGTVGAWVEAPVQGVKP